MRGIFHGHQRLFHCPMRNACIQELRRSDRVTDLRVKILCMGLGVQPDRAEAGLAGMVFEHDHHPLPEPLPAVFRQDAYTLDLAGAFSDFPDPAGRNRTVTVIGNEMDSRFVAFIQLDVKRNSLFFDENGAPHGEGILPLFVGGCKLQADQRLPAPRQGERFVYGPHPVLELVKKVDTVDRFSMLHAGHLDLADDVVVFSGRHLLGNRDVRDILV